MIKSINADLDEVKKSGTRQATMEWNDQEALCFMTGSRAEILDDDYTSCIQFTCQLRFTSQM